MTASWHARAACRGTDQAQWFPRQATEATLRTCYGCPVRVECLDEALRTELPTARAGIWGGLSANARSGIPDLPALRGPRPERLAALRDYIAEHHPAPEPERTPAMTTPHTPATAAADAPAELRHVGKLLAWADKHPDTRVQDQAARARDTLDALRQRYAQDAELTAIDSEAAELEKRLGELRARRGELTPPKRQRKRGSYVRDYDTREVRAWAANAGVECPARGQIPRVVLEAWRAQNTGAQA